MTRFLGSLDDHHREWCAFCLDYIPASTADADLRKELHHVLPAAWVAARFGNVLDFAWVVPAHAYCHRAMQADADAAARYLDELLAGARTIEERDQLAHWFHDHGYYWYSVLVNLDTLLDEELQLDEQGRWRRCQYLLSGAAGIRGAQNLPDLLLPQGTTIRHPEVSLALTNLKAARGHAQKARALLVASATLLESIPKVARRLLRPAQLRRTAQIKRSLHSASDAVRAAESEYSQTTAFVIHGILSIDNKQFASAEEALTSLDARSGKMSWLYEAEASFIRALHEIFASPQQPESVYGHLVKAQYIYVTLGLQFTISPELHRLGFAKEAKPRNWTPADVLRVVTGSEARWRGLGEDECRLVRREWLQSVEPLYEQIFRALKGGSKDTPQPTPGYSENLNDGSRRRRRRLPLTWSPAYA